MFIVSIFDKRKLLLIFTFFILFPTLIIAQENFSISSLNITIFADGAITAEYNLEVDVTTPRISINPIGDAYINLVIEDGDNNPLDYSSLKGEVTVDTLGSDTVNIFYETFDLTNKTGRIWTFSTDTQVDTSITLPETAIIISINQIPKAIFTIGGKNVLTIPAGKIIISYNIGVLGTKEHALTLILTAEDKINIAEKNNIIVNDAIKLLQDSKTYFTQENYFKAEEIATDTVTLTSEIIEMAAQARKIIDTVTNDFVQIIQNSNSIDIEKIQILLDDAELKYSLGEYTNSEDLANQAHQYLLISQSDESFSSIIIIGTIIFVLGLSIVIILFIIYRRKNINKPSTDNLSQKQWRNINLDKIFFEKPNLRLEDQDVIKYIVDSGGEAFESEIRDKFQLPKTTVWRLGKRLVNENIVEIVNMRGNNLVKILSEYEEK